MKLLVTRPALDAGPLADLLKAQGHTVVIAPLLTIRFRDAEALDLSDVTGLLFTSGNGVRAFAALTNRRDIPVFAVGDRTAVLARDQGFADIESADGDVAALAALVSARRRPENGVLLHVTGSEVAGDLAGRLEAAGFTLRRATLYDAEPATELTPETRAALAQGTLDGALLFSPRTARQFAALVRKAGLRSDGLAVWCLSPAVADALGDLPRAQTHVAAEPTQDALLQLVPPARPAGPVTSPSKSTSPSKTPDTERPQEDVLTTAPDQKEAPSVTSDPKPAPTTTAPPAPTATPTSKPASKLASKPGAKPGKAPHGVPLIAAGAAIVIIAGGIGIFRPQIKEWLVTAGVLAGKPAAPLERPSAAPAETPAETPAPAAPAQSAELTAPEPTKPERTKPEPAKPEPTTPGPTNPGPAIASPTGGTAQTAAPAAGETAANTAPSTAPSTATEPEAGGARLDADEARIDRLQRAADAAGQLQQRLAALEAKPAADPASVQAVTAGLADAVGRIARLEAQVQQQASVQRNEKAMILAIAELKDRLAGSGPFDGPVAVLKAAAGDDPALAPSLGVLDKFAARGVIGRTVLVERLDALPAALNEPTAPPSDAGLWQRIEARAQKLVTIRRVDDGSGGSLPPGPERTLATAAAALKAGDLAGAVEAVRGLDGQAAEIAKPWLDQAQDRLAVEQAADRLMTVATQRLQAAGAAGQDKAP